MIGCNTIHMQGACEAVREKMSKSRLLLVMALLCFSGNPAVNSQRVIDFLEVGFAALLAVGLIIRERRIITPELAVIAGAFGLIMAVQTVSFSFFPAVTIAGFFVRLFIGYAVVILVKDFSYTYMLAMVVLAIVSFVFYIPEQIGHVAGVDVGALFGDIIAKTTYKREAFVHTFWQDVSYRNAGMFWEPGAFAGYLNLALVFLVVHRSRLSRPAYTWYLIILSIALFTTMSTAGYLVYPLVLLLHCRWQPENRRKAALKLLVGMYVVVPVAVAVCTYGFHHLEFMHEKIDRESKAVEYMKGRWHRGRIGSLVFDWDYIRQRPLTGWGLHSRTRYALHPSMEGSEGMGNGMSDFTAKFGITGMAVFLVAFFRGFMFLTHRNLARSVLGTMVVLLTLQGEAFLGYPLFLGLMFLCPPAPLMQTSRGYPMTCLPVCDSANWRFEVGERTCSR